jgi:hypothetical protein
VTNEPDDKAGKREPTEGEERPTVAPPFDPIAFAQEVRGGRPSPLGGTPALGGALPRVMLPHETFPVEPVTPFGAMRAAMPTLTDPAELEAARAESVQSTPASRGAPQHPTPLGLSLANARAPSDPPKIETSTVFASALDRAWDEIVTSPPPPLQRDLLDSMSRDIAVVPPPDSQAALSGSDKVPTAGNVPAAPEVPALPTVHEMNDRVALGDYTGALEIAEKLLESSPGDEDIIACADNCRVVLKNMHTARIGPLDRVPVVMVARDQLRWLSIDHRAGFVLSLVDGVSSLEMILDVSGMPELDALRILSELAQQRIISFR